MIAFQACALSVTFRSEISSYVLSEIFEGTGLSKLRWKLFKTLRTLILASGVLKWQRRTTFIWQLQTHQNCLSFSWCGLVAWDNKLNCLWKILWQRFERTLFFQWFFGLKSSISLLVTQKLTEFTRKFWSWSLSWPTTEKNNFPCLLLFWRARMRAVMLLCWHI